MSTATRSSRRQSERIPEKLPVVLLVDSEGEKFEWGASTADVSERGLRIRSNVPLSPGENLDVRLIGAIESVKRCRVVWVNEPAADQAGEFGLTFLN